MRTEAPLIEIVERKREMGGPHDCIVANDVRINGQSVLGDRDITIEVGPDEITSVTLTLFPRELSIRSVPFDDPPLVDAHIYDQMCDEKWPVRSIPRYNRGGQSA